MSDYQDLINNLIDARNAAAGADSAHVKLRFPYSHPDPFVLPVNNLGHKHSMVTFDGRYLEEIMYYINLYRTDSLGLSAIRFNLYDGSGRVKSTFIPELGQSNLNNAISIVNFVNYVEEIKNAIEESLVEPDSLSAHFGRCFNAPHYDDPFVFVSPAMYEKYTGTIRERMTFNGDFLEFYNFPIDISEETLFKTFNKFQYNIPAPSHPARQILLDAFRTANSQIEDIPLFSRMEAGEWPLTRSELTTLLGLGIYGIHPDPQHRPTIRENFTQHADKYVFNDHRRVFWAAVSFMIQALRFQPPTAERFRAQYKVMDDKWWVSRWFWRTGLIAAEYEDNYLAQVRAQGVNRLWRFDLAYWHLMGYARTTGAGLNLSVPLGSYGRSLRRASYQDGIIGIGGLGLHLPNAQGVVIHSNESILSWFAGRALTDSMGDNAHFETQFMRNRFFFHKYSKIMIGGDVPSLPAGGGSENYRGGAVLLRLDDGDPGPVSIYGAHLWFDHRTPNYLGYNGLPVDEYLYNGFKRNNTTPLSPKSNWLRQITIALRTGVYGKVVTPTTQAWAGGYIKDCGRFCDDPNCCDVWLAYHHPTGPAWDFYQTRGNLLYSPVGTTIDYVALMDDKIHMPEDFEDE